MENKEGDFGLRVYIKKAGGLPRSAVLPLFSLPVFNFFNFFHKNNKSEPMTNRQKVRIILFWWTIGGSEPKCAANKDRIFCVILPHIHSAGYRLRNALELVESWYSARLAWLRRREFSLQTQMVHQRSTPSPKRWGASLVDHRGIEPLTSRLRTWRSPS